MTKTDTQADYLTSRWKLLRSSLAGSWIEKKQKYQQTYKSFTRNLKPKILHNTSEKQMKPFGKRTKSNQINSERATKIRRGEVVYFCGCWITHLTNGRREVSKLGLESTNDLKLKYVCLSTRARRSGRGHQMFLHLDLLSTEDEMILSL